jgi:hypothetical protein
MHHYEGKPVGMWPAVKLKSKWEQNIKINPTYVGCKDVLGIEVVLFCLVNVSIAECWSSHHTNGWMVCLFVYSFIYSKIWCGVFSSYISLQIVRMNE